MKRKIVDVCNNTIVYLHCWPAWAPGIRRMGRGIHAILGLIVTRPLTWMLSLPFQFVAWQLTRRRKT